MSYFRYIDNGEGPTKLFIGGIHGHEGQTSIQLLKRLKKEDFAPGQIYIYNLNDSPYVSTLKEEFFESPRGLEIINLINKHKPDFYCELHSYNIDNFSYLVGDGRYKSTGVPPLIDCGDYILVSSVSPLIRMKYFEKDTICKTLEIPTLHNMEKLEYAYKNYGFIKNKSINRYMNLLYLVTSAKDYLEYQRNITKYYPKQVDLAIKYVVELYNKSFSPF